jgi:hypothetical protein
MSWGNSLRIGGTKVENFPGRYTVDVIDGFWAPGGRRGDDYEIPGRNGSYGARLPYDRYLISISMFVMGATLDEFNSNVIALGQIFRASPENSGRIGLERRLYRGPGEWVAHTAQGRWATGMNLQMVNHTYARADLQIYNLSGAWWNGSNWIVP